MSDVRWCAWCGDPLGPCQTDFCNQKCADDFAADHRQSRQRASASDRGAEDAAIPPHACPPETRPVESPGSAGPFAPGKVPAWTEEETEALRRILASGVSALEAAARLSERFNRPFTKNMVIGRCDRLGIELNPDLRHVLTSGQIQEIHKASPSERTAAIARRLGVSSSSVHGVRSGRTYRGCRKTFKPTPNPFPDVGGCLWPRGHPNDPQFHFCGGPRLHGKPYCAAHAAVAYVRVRADEADTIFRPPGIYRKAPPNKGVV